MVHFNMNSNFIVVRAVVNFDLMALVTLLNNPITTLLDLSF